MVTLPIQTQLLELLRQTDISARGAAGYLGIGIELARSELLKLFASSRAERRWSYGVDDFVYRLVPRPGEMRGRTALPLEGSDSAA